VIATFHRRIIITTEGITTIVEKAVAAVDSSTMASSGFCSLR
jgi:hypothetical protein